jgi:ABC-type antimicrobial peptide transport system permease subunit
MLLYSLLQTNVEAISFENAVKRMIGMTKRGVMSVLTLQALAYGIIPLILGLSVSQLLLNSVAQIVVSIDVDFKLPYSSILLAGSLAILCFEEKY